MALMAAPKDNTGRVIFTALGVVFWLGLVLGSIAAIAPYYQQSASAVQVAFAIWLSFVGAGFPAWMVLLMRWREDGARWAALARVARNEAIRDWVAMFHPETPDQLEAAIKQAFEYQEAYGTDLNAAMPRIRADQEATERAEMAGASHLHQ